MARNIAVAQDVYEMLSREKKEGESFSEVIRRIVGKRKSVLEFAGAWKDIPDGKYREMEAAWRWANQPLEEALGRRRRRIANP
jgi:predicted CopG family antitoxin